MTYEFDGAGRVSSAAGSTQYVTAVTYAVHGAVAGLTLAGGSRFEKTCFNNRLQASAMLLRTLAPAADCSDATGNLAKLTFDYGSLTPGADGSSSNNGNLRGQSISDGASWSASQSYDYL